MDKNTKPRIPVQDENAWTLLSLLAAATSRAGHTFSWYTSKKGRVWATLKGFRPIQYSTSVELMPDMTDEMIFDALKVLYSLHFPKMMLEAPPLPTWIPARDLPAKIDDACQYINLIWLRWRGGEIFWEGDSVMNNDNAMMEGVNNDEENRQAT